MQRAGIRDQGAAVTIPRIPMLSVRATISTGNGSRLTTARRFVGRVLADGVGGRVDIVPRPRKVSSSPLPASFPRSGIFIPPRYPSFPHDDPLFPRTAGAGGSFRTPAPAASAETMSAEAEERPVRRRAAVEHRYPVERGAYRLPSNIPRLYRCGGCRLARRWIGLRFHVRFQEEHGHRREDHLAASRGRHSS